MEIQGKIIKALPEIKGTGAHGEWRKAQYVIETIEMYPKHMVFDVFDGQSGRIDRLAIKEGKEMRIFFDIDAHEYNGKWYNSINAYDAREIEK